MNGSGKPSPVQTGVAEVPVTINRPPYNPSGQRELPNPGTARANRAATTQAPGGTQGWADKHATKTVLQQHCDFFDRDHDGVIWPHDTFFGFRAVGFGVVLSLGAAFAIHTAFSYPTCPTLLPDPFFRVFVRNIHRAKHGSDSGVYDNEGRFVPQKFEDFFSKYSKGKEGLTWSDIMEGLAGQRVIMDPIGIIAAFLSWLAAYILLAEDGFVRKEDLRRLFDGSIFEEKAGSPRKTL